GRIYVAWGEWIKAFQPDGSGSELFTIRYQHYDDDFTPLDINVVLVSHWGLLFGATLQGELFQTVGPSGQRTAAGIPPTSAPAMDARGIIYEGSASGLIAATTNHFGSAWKLSITSQMRSAMAVSTAGVLYF